MPAPMSATMPSPAPVLEASLSVSELKAKSKDPWRMGFHLMPPRGWLNDPNGLCQFDGCYHIFHQYSPDWPDGTERGWGHFTSSDLVHWRHHGMVIRQDSPEDANGAYSGCALIMRGAASNGGDLMRLYYTGNVKEPGAYDHIHNGRQANIVTLASEDGFAFSKKTVLMRNADYPEFCTCHVRDPKVWEQDDAYWMLLGARNSNDEGLMLVFRSKDGLVWEFVHSIDSAAPFGYMWECPDRIELDGCEYLSCCPQGMEEFSQFNGLRDQAGYFPMPTNKKVLEITRVDPADFTSWDEGFDFYAPQMFVDESGRTIMVPWLGHFMVPFDYAPRNFGDNVPQNLGWIQCLGIPRELTRRSDGRILQWPVAELENLRGDPVEFVSTDKTARTAHDGVPARSASLRDHRADLVVSGIEGTFSIALDDELVISCADGRTSLAFVSASDAEGHVVSASDAEGHVMTANTASSVGAGRTSRCVETGEVHDIRVLIDNSAVELYINNGAFVFSTRWFPVNSRLTLDIAGKCDETRLWPMGDGMAATYAAHSSR